MAALFNTSTTKTVIGLDISPHAIYMIEAKGPAHAPQLLRAEQCLIEDTIFSEGVLENPEALSETLQALLATCYGDQVALCLDDQFLTRRIIQLEKNLSEEDLEDNVSFELERSLSFPIEDAYFDFSILKTNSEDDQINDIAVTACRRNLIDKPLGVLEQLGFTVQLVSSLASVLGHFLMGIMQAEQQSTSCALINIDADVIHAVIYQGDQELFTDSLKYEIESVEHSIESLITLAQTEHNDLQLHTLYITGMTLSHHDIETLQQQTQANVITLNPFSHWQQPLPNISQPLDYCLAAALAQEGLRP